MADFYQGLQATAQKLIADKGADVIVRRQNSTFDPVTSVVTPTTVISQNLKAVILASPNQSAEFDTVLAEEQIQGRRKQGILSTVGATFRPEPLDELEVGTDLWTVYGVSAVDPTHALPVIYKVGLMFKSVTP